MMTLDKVKGVGPKSKMLLGKLGIEEVDDLVSHYPFRYEKIVRSDLAKAEELEKVIIDGKIDSAPILIRLKGNLNKMNIRVVTSEGKVVGVSIFNRAFLKKQLTVGSSVTVFNKYEKSKNIILASEILAKSQSSLPHILKNLIFSNFESSIISVMELDLPDFETVMIISPSLIGGVIVSPITYT